LLIPTFSRQRSAASQTGFADPKLSAVSDQRSAKPVLLIAES
jgi:hypothetical protein